MNLYSLSIVLQRVDALKAIKSVTMVRTTKSTRFFFIIRLFSLSFQSEVFTFPHSVASLPFASNARVTGITLSSRLYFSISEETEPVYPPNTYISPFIYQQWGRECYSSYEQLIVSQSQFPKRTSLLNVVNKHPIDLFLQKLGSN